MKSLIVRNDIVEVITGNDSSSADRKKTERVLQVMPESGRIVVEHVNFVTKHVRKSRQNPDGARLEKEAPISISNVMLVCPTCDRGRRVKIKKTDKGKVRICAKCGAEIPKPKR